MKMFGFAKLLKFWCRCIASTVNIIGLLKLVSGWKLWMLGFGFIMKWKTANIYKNQDHTPEKDFLIEPKMAQKLITIYGKKAKITFIK